MNDRFAVFINSLAPRQTVQKPSSHPGRIARKMVSDNQAAAKIVEIGSMKPDLHILAQYRNISITISNTINSQRYVKGHVVEEGRTALENGRN